MCVQVFFTASPVLACCRWKSLEKFDSVFSAVESCFWPVHSFHSFPSHSCSFPTVNSNFEAVDSYFCTSTLTAVKAIVVKAA